MVSLIWDGTWSWKEEREEKGAHKNQVQIPAWPHSAKNSELGLQLLKQLQIFWDLYSSYDLSSILRQNSKNVLSSPNRPRLRTSELNPASKQIWFLIFWSFCSVEMSALWFLPVVCSHWCRAPRRELMGWKESCSYFSVSAPCEALPVALKRSMKSSKSQDDKMNPNKNFAVS